MIIKPLIESKINKIFFLPYLDIKMFSNFLKNYVNGGANLKKFLLSTESKFEIDYLSRKICIN